MSRNKNAENVVIFLSNMTSNVTEAEKTPKNRQCKA